MNRKYSHIFGQHEHTFTLGLGHRPGTRLAHHSINNGQRNPKILPLTDSGEIRQLFRASPIFRLFAKVYEDIMHTHSIFPYL